MELVKKVKVVVLGLVVLLAIGCGKEDDTVKVKEPEVVSPKCQLTEWQIHDGGGSIYKFAYNYDGQGNLIKKDEFWINASLGTNALRGHIDFEYNADNQVSKMSWFFYNDLWEYYTYQYNAAGKVERQNNFTNRTASGPVLANWYIYDYDANQKLIKQSLFGAGSTTPSQYWEFTYPAANKVISKWFEVPPSGPKLSGTEEYTFDNQPRAPRFGKMLQLEDMLSEHNLVLKTANYGSQTNTWNYLYRYNSDGFPVSKRTSSSGRPAVLEDSITYICQ